MTHTPELPMWQRIDIALSEEWDQQSSDWKAEHADKAAYMNDAEHRQRIEIALNTPVTGDSDVEPETESSEIETSPSETPPPLSVE